MRKIRIEGGGMKAVHFLAFGCALYLVFFGFQVLSRLNDDSANDGVLLVRQDHTALVHLAKEEKGLEPHFPDSGTPLTRSVRVTPASYVLHLQQGAESGGRGIDQVASEAIAMGRIAWQETLLQLGKVGRNRALEEEKESLKRREACKQSIAKKGDELGKGKVMMMLPCGLRVGSSITVVGKPKRAHEEAPGIWVSQFMMELQGLSLKESALVDGRVEAEQEEDPPRVFHFNPRLKGDWSSKPVIELNTCYRMQWGAAQRCEGLPSSPEDDTVDGFPKCEKWLTDVNQDQKKSTSTWWLNRLIGRTKKTSIDWPYPFAEDKLFVLTLSAGLEGYHVNVDGTHVASFPYRTGFVLEDATGFSINGDIDVHTVVATSLPTTHSSFSPHRLLEMSDKWKAPALPEGSVDLFIGILSAGNHFSERMAVRKSWMQSQLIQSSKVVARFFVALNARKEVNIQLKKEAEFFGDMIIVPFIDNYDLVVLKTIAICKYGAQNLSAKYIMKCDDDNFVRVDAVMKEIDKLSSQGSLYIGNLNYYHKPLRTGKWAVTYEEWPEDDYPPYANGPGYIISSDIAKFIVSLYNNQALRLFKMEDVSMGMWVEQFNASTHVHYSHDWKFCQFGCIDGYYTAHYQSPRQMLCMWEKLLSGKVQCCNMR